MTFRFNPDSFEFIPSLIAPVDIANRQLLVAVDVDGRYEQLLCAADGSLQLFTDIELTQNCVGPLVTEHYLGQLNGCPLWVTVLQESTSSSHLPRSGLRALLNFMGDSGFLLASKALQVAQWFADHRFCGRCGVPTDSDCIDRARVCLLCNLRFYPRISPCMIVLVTRGDELLLAHHARASRLVYSTLAGFVEPGERVEDTVHREVREEVGISLGKLDYFYSQPWPFPNRLMLGFFADYEAGEIAIDGTEILDARWFRYDQLPSVPSKSSVAGQLIDHYVKLRTQLNLR